MPVVLPGRKRLSVGAEKLRPWRHAARHSRDRNKGGRGRRRHGLEDAFLVHPRTVLALPTGCGLVSAASNLELPS